MLFGEESSFRTIVTIIALILFIITLILITFAVSHFNKDKQFPPVTGTCPDYWTDISDSKDSSKVVCKNTHNLGTCNKSTMNFSGGAWNGNDSICNKAKWARQCNLSWDGITNSNFGCS